MRQEITAATRMVIVCNPNNPTSTALPLDEIAAFVADVPRHVLVIVDEAYCEFNVLDDPDASLELLRRHSNLALLRTFSKVYGLCGLRVGFALCGSEELRTAVDQVRQPFFCNAAAQAAAVEALRHQDEVVRRVERNLAERMGLEDGLRELGIEPAESQANFVWFDLGEGVDEREVVRGLGRARRARARRDGARPRGRAARDGRHRRGEPALPRGARRAAGRRPARRLIVRPGAAAVCYKSPHSRPWPTFAPRPPARPQPHPPACARPAVTSTSTPSATAPGDLARRSAGVTAKGAPSAIGPSRPSAVPGAGVPFGALGEQFR